MRSVNKAAFALRRRKVIPLFEHFVEILCKHCGIRCFRRIKIRHWPFRKKQREHRTAPVERKIKVQFYQTVPDAALQIAACFFETFVEILVFVNNLERFDPGGQRQWITRKRPGLVYRAGWGDHFHDLPSATIGSDRQATAYYLAKSCQVGTNIIYPL